MNSSQKSVEWLNKILNNELIAIYRYLLHAKLHEKWGFSKLAKHFHSEASDEMEHAEKIMDRILHLNSSPDLNLEYKPCAGKKPKECLSHDAKMEKEAIATLKSAILHLATTEDFTTHKLLTNMLQQEEEHLDWIESQLFLIDQVGLNNYLQTQI